MNIKIVKLLSSAFMLLVVMGLYGQDVKPDTVRLITWNNIPSVIFGIKNTDKYKYARPVFVEVQIFLVIEGKTVSKTIQLQTGVLAPMKTQNFTVPFNTGTAGKKIAFESLKEIVIRCDIKNQITENSEENNMMVVTELEIKQLLSRKGSTSGTEL
jgi:hypothetical protein